MSRIRAQHPNRYRLALSGDLPAEALSTADRGRLVWELYRRGWSDRQIAEHTRLTDYTTQRIRLWQAAQRGHHQEVAAA